MLSSLTEKLSSLFASLSKTKQLTESNISEAVRNVRLALLDADVNYGVVSHLVNSIKKRAVGSESIKGVKAAEQFVHLVHEELVCLMGNDEAKLHVKGAPAVFMLCGLQGAGKTTHVAKLAYHLKKKEWGKRPLLVACDLQRPAAVQQLQILGESIDVPVFTVEEEKDPLQVARQALTYAKKQEFDVMIVDTAGRLHVDKELMQQLVALKQLLQPQEVLFVASAATGQDAVKTATVFDQEVGITGSILTMLDGTARAGAAISIRYVTNKPLLFEGTGERMEDLQAFHPVSMADRILGMGDVINLVKKAQDNITEEESKNLEKKFLQANFTYEDYLKQMVSMKKMGSFKNILKMLPGVGDMPDIEESEKEFRSIEAMILSMTSKERQGLVELVPSRRKRIAEGSGMQIADVNHMVKKFRQMKQFAKQFSSLKKQYNAVTK